MTHGWLLLLTYWMKNFYLRHLLDGRKTAKPGSSLFTEKHVVKVDLNVQLFPQVTELILHLFQSYRTHTYALIHQEIQISHQLTIDSLCVKPPITTMH